MKFDFVIGNPPYQQEQESTDINPNVVLGYSVI